MSDLIMGMGLVFELPVIVYFLSRIGILTPKLMRDKRRYAIVIIFFLAVIISPPDWFSCWLIALPLMLLFEISIGISDRANKARMKKQLIESNN
jgi:sec-independent protein translocase protein TatC